MTSKKKLSTTEWFIFILISGIIMALNITSLLKTRDVDRKLKKTTQVFENKKLNEK